MAIREFWVHIPNDLMDLTRDLAAPEFEKATRYGAMFTLHFKRLEDAEALTWTVRDLTGRLLNVVPVILGHL